MNLAIIFIFNILLVLQLNTRVESQKSKATETAIFFR